MTDKAAKPMTTEELAKSLNVAVRTVEGWRYRGGGPDFYYIGAHVRYMPADVTRWLKRQRRAS